jgi:cyclic pyranopterin phosphate synthase
MNSLVDSSQRNINYLRISVTDRCNLRCIYCMPETGVKWIAHNEILTYEEIATVARIGADLGINKIRITGGEPLTRAELPKLIKMLSETNGVDEISLTTNGIFLKEQVLALKDAGLRRINISLDTFKQERFSQITRLGNLQDVLDGIGAAKDAGLNPVKIDMVVIKDINDDEIIDFARKTYEQGWHIRFIELMPLATVKGIISAKEIRSRIETLDKLETASAPVGNGPARYYRLPRAKGTIGFISPVTEPFCSWCNRLRLTSYGQLCSCLLSDDGVDLRKPLRNNNLPEDEIRRLIRELIASKPSHHNLANDNLALSRKMSQIGG